MPRTRTSIKRTTRHTIIANGFSNVWQLPLTWWLASLASQREGNEEENRLATPCTYAMHLPHLPQQTLLVTRCPQSGFSSPHVWLIFFEIGLGARDELGLTHKPVQQACTIKQSPVGARRGGHTEIHKGATWPDLSG